MAYVLAKSPTFLVKNIEVSTFDNGAWVKEAVTATFLRKTTEELDVLRKEEGHKVLREVLVSVQGLKDGNGQHVVLDRRAGEDFPPEQLPTLEAVLSIPPLMAALARAFWTHQVKGPEKN